MTDNSAPITLLAPLSGTVVPLTEVPDPVFSQKMLGDGIAIQPTGNVLVSPCAGTVSQLHSALHALTITMREGVQILLHIGLETVALAGKGFTAKVALGDQVSSGQPLVEFDLAYLTANAQSPLTMMVISDNGQPATMKFASGAVIAGQSPVAELSPLEESSCSSEVLCEAGLHSAPVLVRNPNGIHARPAAVLANAAKRHACDITLTAGQRKANAKSVTSVLGLGAKQHDHIVVSASGPGAAEALADLVLLVESGLGENVLAKAKKPEQPEPHAPECPAASPPVPDPERITGITASPGTGHGLICHWRRNVFTLPEESRGQEQEEKALDQALGEAKKELEELQKRLRDNSDSGKAAIFAAHAELLEDPELSVTVRKAIAGGKSAAHAWKEAVVAQAEKLSSLNNELLAARAGDIRDVGRRVLAHITGAKAPFCTVMPDAVIVAEELTPSEVESLDGKGVRGICTLQGSPTSHASLLARSSGIPALAGVERRILDVPDGTGAVLYADKGMLRLNPDAKELEAVRAGALMTEQKKKAELEAAAGPAVTKDGVRIKVAANIGGVGEVEKLLEYGAEGVGLLRSEFLFLQRTSPPDEGEQAAAYTAIARALGPTRDFVIRTLDAGGDKPLSYLPLEQEANPFLGIRGIRINMLGTELFRTQVRAALAAAAHTRLHILFPMIADVSELRDAKSIVLEEKNRIAPNAAVSVGIMVEVPSAALLAENLASEVDFFSIGTNDLTQQTLAIDRGHPTLARMADAMHPSVLKLIGMTVEGARKHGKPVAVCGELATRPEAVPILIGLGVDELSVNVDAVPAIKNVIRGQTMTQCRQLAADALTMLTADEVRRYAAAFCGEGDKS